MSGSLGTLVPLDEYYTYDRLNRLATMQRGTLTGSPPTGIAGTPVIEQDWTLDPTGNWRGYLTKAAGTTDQDQSRASSTVNAITTISETTGPSWVDPTYDAAGNTITIPQPVPTSSFSARYDAWNRLAWVKDGGNFVAQYRYDGRNRRIEKKSYTGGTLSETRQLYSSNDWQVLEERTSTTADKQYVWGIRYVDELVCRDDATPQRLYALQDANFNVTSITDTSGAVQERFVYDPYGNASVRDASTWSPTTDTFNWVYRHQGGRLELNTNLYYFRNRDYQPDLGRWGQRDMTGYGGGVNLYEYLNSDCVRRSDPFGLQTTQPSPKAGPVLTIRETHREVGKCGSMEVDFQWSLNRPATVAGIILQKVTVTGQIKPEKPFTRTYWEIWHINPGATTTVELKKIQVTNPKADSDESQKCPMTINGKAGSFSWEMTAELLEGQGDPPGFKVGGVPGLGGGNLMTSDKDPGKLPGGTGSVGRSVKADWDCTHGEQKTNVTVK